MTKGVDRGWDMRLNLGLLTRRSVPADTLILILPFFLKSQCHISVRSEATFMLTQFRKLST